MNTNNKIESSALLQEWRNIQQTSSNEPIAVSKTYDSKFEIRIDQQTSEWILDLEFPPGGPTPKIIESLKFIRVKESRTSTIPNRRRLSVEYNPNGNDCLDLWKHFAEDILAEAKATKAKTHCAQSVERTFKKWKKWWPGAKEVKLTFTLGLFGELVFLRSLSKELSPAVAVRAWQGSSFRDHDFSVKRTAFEVKASQGSGKTVIISNLHQLDDADLTALYLVHIPLRPSDDKTHSLQSIYEEIQSTLADDASSLASFIKKLGKVKFFKATKEQREGVGFCFKRVRRIYHVTKDFPRILKSDLLEKFKPGIDLKAYKLNLPACPNPLEKEQEDELWAGLRAAVGNSVTDSV